MLKDLKDKPMKKLMQYVPFILWSIPIIILAVLALIMFPILFLWEKFHYFIRKDVARGLKMDQEYKTFDYSVAIILPGK
jgi:hypothetical protein